MKKKFKTLLATVLSATMMFSMVACGGNNSGSNETKPANTAQQSSNKVSKTEAEVPKTDSEIVNLKWVQVGNGQPSNYEQWREHINKYLAEKIGVNIDVEVVGWGDWESRRSTLINTNGDYDIMFTNAATYLQDVKMGAFLDLTSLISEYAPKLYDSMPAEYWEATRINGEIYAVPTYKDSSMTFYFILAKDMADKYGIDITKIKDLHDLEEPMKKIYEGEGKAPFVLNKEGISNSLAEKKYDSMGLVGLGVGYNDKDRKLVPIFEQEDVMKELKLLHKWYKAGYINPDAATLGEKPQYRAISIEQGWSGAAKTVWGPNMGVEVEVSPWGETVVSNVTVGGSLNCISASCEHPEKAIEFLQLINTDKYVRDSFFYGLEGDDFVYTEDGKIHKNKEEWSMAGYTQGTFFIVSQRDTTDFNQWDEVKELNAKAKPSPVLGINLDFSEFEDELVNCVEIYNKYKSELYTGVRDPEELVPQIMSELRAAGLDTIREKAQAQIDAAN